MKTSLPSSRLGSLLNAKKKFFYRLGIFAIVSFSSFTTQAQYVFANYSRQKPCANHPDHHFSAGYQFENNFLIGATVGEFNDPWDYYFHLVEPHSLGGFLGYRLKNTKTQVLLKGGAYQLVYGHVNWGFQKELLLFTELQVYRPLIENLNIGVSLDLYKPREAFFDSFYLFIITGIDIQYNFKF